MPKLNLDNFRKFYYDKYVLVEELHPHLREILNSETPDSPYGGTSLYGNTAQKLNSFSKKARQLLKKGEDTGLESDKPKKGSSRAVWFSKDEKAVTIDGKPTHARTVVKIAFPGQLDRFKTESERLLGEHQNEQEAEPHTHRHYSVLSSTDNPGEYHTNENGVVAPVFSHHPDHHYLEMGHVTPIKKAEFQQLTKSKSHPRGLKFDDMFNAINQEHADAHGNEYGGHNISSRHTPELHEKTMEHPFVQNLQNFMHDTGFHPGDISLRNMGIWTHPHTGKQYPVMSDFGFSNDISREYSTRRRRQFARR